MISDRATSLVEHILSQIRSGRKEGWFYYMDGLSVDFERLQREVRAELRRQNIRCRVLRFGRSIGFRVKFRKIESVDV